MRTSLSLQRSSAERTFLIPLIYHTQFWMRSGCNELVSKVSLYTLANRTRGDRGHAGLSEIAISCSDSALPYPSLYHLFITFQCRTSHQHQVFWKEEQTRTFRLSRYLSPRKSIQKIEKFLKKFVTIATCLLAQSYKTLHIAKRIYRTNQGRRKKKIKTNFCWRKNGRNE